VLEIQINPDVADKKRRQWAELKAKTSGYVRLQQPNDQSKPPEFEPEAEDLRFLQTIFPAMDQSTPLPPTIMKDPIVIEFVKFVDYLETTNDMKFANYAITCNSFSEDSLKEIVKYWQEKTQRNKYLFNRRLWKESLSRKQFGPMNPNRLAFQNSNEEKKKQIRVNRKTSQVDLWQQINMTDKNIDMIESVEKLALKREKLKKAALIVSLNLGEKTGLTREFLAEVDKEIKAGDAIVDKIFKSERPMSPPPKETPVPAAIAPTIIQEPVSVVMKNPKSAENEIAYLVSTVLSELYKYSFNINEIKVQNIPELNTKIKTVKRDYSTAVPISAPEKIINLSVRHHPQVYNSFDNHVPYKRFSFRNLNDVYLEKMDRALLEHELKGEHGGNFQFDYAIRGNLHLQEMLREFTHCSFNIRAGMNPDVYNDVNTTSTSNGQVLSYRNFRNSKMTTELLAGDSNELDLGYFGTGERMTIQKQAEQEMSTLNLRAGFQAWKTGAPTKRVKQA